MRRSEKEIERPEELEELLRSAPVCRIGLASGQEYPYVVPVHFVHAGGFIYIHSARQGMKIGMIEKNPRVCVEIDDPMDWAVAEAMMTHLRQRAKNHA